MLEHVSFSKINLNATAYKEFYIIVYFFYGNPHMGLLVRYNIVNYFCHIAHVVGLDGASHHSISIKG